MPLSDPLPRLYVVSGVILIVGLLVIITVLYTRALEDQAVRASEIIDMTLAVQPLPDSATRDEFLTYKSQALSDRVIKDYEWDVLKGIYNQLIKHASISPIEQDK